MTHNSSTFNVNDFFINAQDKQPKVKWDEEWWHQKNKKLELMLLICREKKVSQIRYFMQLVELKTSD